MCYRNPQNVEECGVNVRIVSPRLVTIHVCQLLQRRVAMNLQKAAGVECSVETKSDIQVGRGFRTFHKMSTSRTAVFNWYKHFKETGSNLMFIPCIARMRIKNQHCALGYIYLFVDMRLLHVSATVCHLQGAS
jgi:hypothetical protein